MATAYSTLLGLALPVQGELSGTWGDMVDNGITRYVDIAVAGTVTLTNDGAVSLSLTNGDSSATNIVSSLTGAGTVSAQFAIIKVTGTLTTAKILTPPSSSRTYVVVNAATGSTVTVKASGQTGVSIAVGESAFVYYNGTDYVKVSSTVATGVTSFQTSLSGLTPSTSTTGAVTLAGTLGTANGGTGLTSFTSGGVVYASSTSALATGSALTYDGSNFRVNSGTSWATSTGGVQLSMDGAGSDAYLTTYYDAHTLTLGAGVSLKNLIKISGSDASNNINFRVNNSDAMTLTSTGLGIGTSSPSAKLNVVGGNSIFSNTISEAGFNSTGSNRYSLIYAASTSGTMFLGVNGTSAGVEIDVGGILGNASFFGARTNNATQFLTNNTVRATIDNSGNFGIGTSSPNYKLQVSGASNQISILNSGYGAYMFDVTSGVALAFTKEGTGERARISPNGGFAVGTTADPGAGAIYATGNITAYYSDARLKTVSGKIENALDKVAQLSGVYYTNNSVAKSFGYDSDEVQVGVLAQDVEAVLPQIVKAAPFDLDENGNSKSGENYKTVQYERLVPLLIEAINELQAKVKALESK